MNLNYMIFDDIIISSDIYVIRFEGDIRKCKVIEKTETVSDKFIKVVDEKNNEYQIFNGRLRFICYLSEEDAIRYINFMNNLSQMLI